MHEHVRVLSGYIRRLWRVYPLAERFGGYTRHPPGGYPRGGYIRRYPPKTSNPPDGWQIWGRSTSVSSMVPVIEPTQKHAGPSLLIQ